MYNILDIRKKSLEEVLTLVLEKNRELLNLRFRKSSGDLEKTNTIRLVRKEVARLSTVLAEKQKLLER